MGEQFGTPVKALIEEQPVPDWLKWSVSEETWREIEAIDMNRKLATHAQILFD